MYPCACSGGDSEVIACLRLVHPHRRRSGGWAGGCYGGSSPSLSTRRPRRPQQAPVQAESVVPAGFWFGGAAAPGACSGSSAEGLPHELACLRATAAMFFWAAN